MTYIIHFFLLLERYEPVVLAVNQQRRAVDATVIVSVALGPPLPVHHVLKHVGGHAKGFVFVRDDVVLVKCSPDKKAKEMHSPPA